MPHSYDHGGNIFTAARSLGVLPEAVTDFSASINPLGMSPMARKALICSLDSLVHYPDSNHYELKQVLSRYHNLPPDNFVIA
ncbi:MAG: threonine-phosphate decarboxylase, partial [Geobacteraceae bacterium]|nr:threonine-phosphate decarboxylase [Geobacteraceae bacterium]